MKDRRRPKVKWANNHSKTWRSFNMGKYKVEFDTDDLTLSKTDIEDMLEPVQQHMDAYFHIQQSIPPTIPDLSSYFVNTWEIMWRSDEGYYYKIKFGTNDIEMPENTIETLLHETRLQIEGYLINNLINKQFPN